MSTVTANIALKLIDPATDSLEDGYQEFNWNFTELDRLYQELANSLQAPDAGTLGGEDLAHVLALANATGTLPIVKGGTGATNAEGVRTAIGFDAAWDTKFAEALSVAPTQLDTILEIVAEVQDNDSAIAAINTVLSSKAAQTALDAVDTRITTAEAELNAVLPDGASGTFTRPRMTTTVRDALDMTGKAKGYGIHNTTTEQDEDWDGVSSWDASGGGGTWELITKVTISTTVGFVDLTSFDNTKYDFYQIIFSNVKPVADGANLTFRVSTDGGTSFETTNYQTAFAYGGIYDTYSGPTSEFILGLNVGAGTNEDGVSGVVNIHHPGAAFRTQIHGHGVFMSADGFDVGYLLHGFYEGGDVVDAIRLLWSTDDINAGTIRLMGLKL